MKSQLQNLLSAEIDPAFAHRASFIFSYIEKIKPKRILDVGCGRGFYVYGATQFPFVKEVYGIDVQEKYLAIAKKNIADRRVSLKIGDIYETGFPNEYFDVIICSEVLEHLHDETKALTELKRILRKKGFLLISVPNKNFPFFWDPLNFILMKLFDTHISKDIWWLAGMWADHLRLYTQKEIKDKLEASGFVVKNVQHFVAHSWPLSHFLLYGIGKNIVERLHVGQFSRFSFKKRPIAQLLNKLMAFPTRLDRKNNTKSVDIAIIAQK